MLPFLIRATCRPVVFQVQMSSWKVFESLFFVQVKLTSFVPEEKKGLPFEIEIYRSNWPKNR
jgi:hypothetical protein